MDRTIAFAMEFEGVLVVEMAQAAEERFATHAERRTLRTAVADATQELLKHPINITEYLGALTINQVGRTLAH